jgi:hypothetical protein
LKIAGRRVTTAAAVRRMLLKQNPAAQVPTVSAVERCREISAADKRMAAAGI